jgi:virulence-associated protein VagC
VVLARGRPAAKPGTRSCDRQVRELDMYILRLMSERAKIFQNGGSQAVRLPKSCRFGDDQEEVIVRRVGNQVILEPAAGTATSASGSAVTARRRSASARSLPQNFDSARSAKRQRVLTR